MQQKGTADPQIIEQINNTITKKYDEAVTNYDAAAVAALYTEDAVFVTDSGPLYGRQAIEKFYADSFKALHPKNYITTTDPTSSRMIGTGDNVAESGGWSYTAQAEGGEPFPLKGYWSSIDTREGDGWRISMLTWNITPAETK